jgi:hypothetical protein
MVERNAGLPPDRRIEFRVGINLGDVDHVDKSLDARATVTSTPIFLMHFWRQRLCWETTLMRRAPWRAVPLHPNLTVKSFKTVR